MVVIANVIFGGFAGAEVLKKPFPEPDLYPHLTPAFITTHPLRYTFTMKISIYLAYIVTLKSSPPKSTPTGTSKGRPAGGL